MAIRTDQLLGRLFNVIEKNVGMKDTVVVLSADQASAQRPSTMRKPICPAAM